MSRELVLASTSVYRKSLMERLGVPFRCQAPTVEEEELKVEAEGRGLGPRELAPYLAAEKAWSIAREWPEAIVVGGDQIATIDGIVLGKPGTVAGAVEQLELLDGRTHELLTAIAVVADGKLNAYLDVTRLTVRPLRRDEIERYVAADLPLDCAGSYKLESRGITLFETIVADDHSAITGLPLMALTTILRNLGLAIP